MDWRSVLQTYQPRGEQERRDKATALARLAADGNRLLSRDNRAAHITCSAFIVNAARDKTLFVYHLIYQSWSWTGGHADGDGDLLAVALRESEEETGAKCFLPLCPKPVSLDILPVPRHRKNGFSIPAHRHINFCFLLAGSEAETLRAKLDENSAVRWIPISEVNQFSSEAHMHAVYKKIIGRLADFSDRSDDMCKY